MHLANSYGKEDGRLELFRQPTAHLSERCMIINRLDCLIAQSCLVLWLRDLFLSQRVLAEQAPVLVCLQLAG